MSHPNPHHTPNNPPQDGVVAASTASDAHGSQHPLSQAACHDAFRDALRDLVNHDGTSSINPTNQKCPFAIALNRNGLVTWTPNPAPGKWQITPAGWAFLETRTTRPEETR